MRRFRFGYTTLGPLILLAFGLVWMAFGAKAPIGWGDSATYIDLALELPEVVSAGDVGYFGLRVLPSAVVHGALSILGLPLSEESVFHAFEVWNLLLLVLCAVVWGRLGRSLGLAERTLWLGFVLLFVNFAVLVWGVVVPALTDTTALAIGMLQVWCFLGGRGLLLLGVSIAAAFSWPQAFVAGLVLFLLPRGEAGKGRERRGLWLGWVLGVLLALGYAGLIGTLRLREATALPFAGQQIHWSLIIVSVSAGGAYILWLSRSFLDTGVLEAVRGDGALVRRVALALASVLLVAVVAHAIGYGAASRYPTLLTTPTSFLVWSVLTSVILPFLPLLAHVVYLGPVFLLLALRPGAVTGVIRDWGAGGAVYAWACGLLLLNPSSRVSISALPLLVVAVCVVADREGWSRRLTAAVAAVAFVLSRAWWPVWTLVGAAGIRHQQVPGWIRWMRGWLPLENLSTPGSPPYLEFPQQHFFMVQGPWMSVEMYVLQGAVVLALGGLLALALRREAGGVPSSAT